MTFSKKDLGCELGCELGGGFWPTESPPSFLFDKTLTEACHRLIITPYLDTTTASYEDNRSTLSLEVEEDLLQSLKTTQQQEREEETTFTALRDTTNFGERLPTTTFTTSGALPTTTSGTTEEPVAQHLGYKLLSGTTSTSTTSEATEEPIAQQIGYKLLRTTTPTVQTRDDVEQHLTYRDGFDCGENVAYCKM